MLQIGHIVQAQEVVVLVEGAGDGREGQGAVQELLDGTAHGGAAGIHVIEHVGGEGHGVRLLGFGVLRDELVSVHGEVLGLVAAAVFHKALAGVPADIQLGVPGQ